jgi:hypothetical protein
MPTKPKPEFAAVYGRLQAIVKKYAKGSLEARSDKKGSYALVGPPHELFEGKEVWFAAVFTKKNYISYHLIPVYVFPELLKGMSPSLKKRMQGKACFNFSHVDDAQFRELAKLTDAGYKRFKQLKLIA